MSSPEKALNIRISTHERFSKYEINDWILSTINLSSKERVLDIGCGNGKQLIPYSREIGPDGHALGLDISDELLDEAKRKAKDSGVKVELRRCGMEDLASCLDGKIFDVISSCFALYYSKDYVKTMNDIWNLLEDGGRCFICGPTQGNNLELAELHTRVTELPPAFVEHTRFMEEEALPAFRNISENIETSIFRNPIEFPDKSSLLDYWKSYTLFNDDARLRFEELVDQIFESDGTFTTQKVVLGILVSK